MLSWKHMEHIILVRHGETEKNTRGELHTIDDAEFLNKTGVKQVKKTASKLKKFSPVMVYSSKGRRAIDSGKIIAKELGILFETVRGMQERDWGKFSGKTWEEVEKILQKMSLEERYLYRPPHGESWKEFENRLIRAITKILSHNKDKTVVVVSHGGAIRALMPYLLDMPREESFKYNPENASFAVFSHQNGKFSQVS